MRERSDSLGLSDRIQRSRRWPPFMSIQFRHRSDGWQASVIITPAAGDVGFIEPGKIYSSQEEAETDALKTAQNYIDQAVR